jgi:hypothetical protein
MHSLEFRFSRLLTGISNLAKRLDKQEDLRKRFLAMVNKTGGHWLWTGGKNPQGYGYIWHNGRMRRAQRVAWELFGREPIRGRQVLHKCNLRHCVNVAHLYLGTPKDNAEDREA